MKLSKYREKRDFTRTAEPKGRVRAKAELRFVVQLHKARRLHYDFRIEHGGVLLSWALPKGLPSKTGEKRLAVHVEDHPVDYLAFEGTIAKGNYGAGSVEIYDRGRYRSSFDVEKGMKKGHVRLALDGGRYEGVYDLVRMDGENWLMIKADAREEKRTRLPFSDCEVALPTLVKTLPTGAGWIAEFKYDGYRILAFKEGKSVRLLSRNRCDYTEKFPAIARALKEIPRDNFVVDGEAVAFDNEGKSDFALLRQAMRKGNGIFYVAFDLLALDGEDLRPLPLLKRKEILERLVYGQGDALVYSAHVTDLKRCLDFSKERGLEGIVVKEGDAPYPTGRSERWKKIKNRARREFVVGGYTRSPQTGEMKALLLGGYREGKLYCVGKAGTGMDGREKAQLARSFHGIERKSSPFCGESEKGAVYVTPSVVVEVEYQEMTKEGRLRQASFLGIRTDKNAKEVALDETE